MLALPAASPPPCACDQYITQQKLEGTGLGRAGAYVSEWVWREHLRDISRLALGREDATIQWNRPPFCGDCSGAMDWFFGGQEGGGRRWNQVPRGCKASRRMRAGLSTQLHGSVEARIRGAFAGRRRRRRTSQGGQPGTAQEAEGQPHGNARRHAHRSRRCKADTAAIANKRIESPQQQGGRLSNARQKRERLERAARSDGP